MRIALDATALLGPRTGVGAFTLGAMDALVRRDDTEIYGYALSWRGRSLLREVLPVGATSGWSVPAAPLLRLWSRTDLVPVEWIMDLDEPVEVVHGTNFVVPPARRAARVVTVHDLTCVRFPELCTPTTRRYPALLRRAIRAGAWVHTPTAAVAAEVCELLGAPPERVRAVHHGLSVPDPGQADPDEPDPDEADPDQAADGAGGRRLAARLTGAPRYVLALGTVEPRKDLPLLVRAFDHLAADRPDLGLVIAGPDGWGADALTSAIAAARHRDRIARTGHVDGAVRVGLLAGASALAFPSVYEGFGLPPLEAMAAGVPVVATAAGAVREVCGDAAALTPVGDVSAFGAALAMVLDDPARAAALVEAGRRRAAGYSWERCADGLMDLYRSALGA